MEEQAKQLLALEMQLKTLKAQADALRADLVLEMALTNTQEVVVPGSGSVSYVKESNSSRVDTKTAQALLEEAGISIPVNLVTTKHSVRVYLNK